MSAPSLPARRRDATESRERLVAAAAELFSERGYERTTIRDVGEKAGVDPAMIARYFGGKSGLYLASVHGNRPASGPIDVLDSTAVRALVDRVSTVSETPMLHAIVQPHTDAELQSAALEWLRARLVTPAADTAREAGREDAELRSEVMVAALAGILLSRKSGSLATLQAAPAERVAALISGVADALLARGAGQR